MRKFKIGILGLLLAVSLAASCSRLRAPSDDAITTDIKAKMFSDPMLKNASVDVVTHSGVVTLTGQVPDDSAHLAAFKIATQEKGVSKVDDQISVAIAQATPDLGVPAAAARERSHRSAPGGPEPSPPNSHRKPCTNRFPDTRSESTRVPTSART